jgi:hypothetical protein
VISRLELRWDRSDNFGVFGASGNLKNAFMLAANVIYKF